ncbi:MAG: heparinase II/III family protein [Pseudomonadota bacterium]|nr:heparinase II/III family protein [Pseudomonadota bacterium]
MLSELQGTEDRPGLIGALMRFGYGSPLYRYTLIGRTPDRLLGTPPEIILGSAAAGQAILAGYLAFAGERREIGDLGVAPVGAGEAWLCHLNGFAWLGDLRAVGSDEARARARTLTASWIRGHGNWSALSWRPDVTARRLISWLTHFGFFAADASDEFREPLYTELARQARHLARYIAKGASSSKRITALKGLIYCGIALPDSDKYLHQGLRQLETELRRQILPDGGHISRNPSVQLQLLGDLIAISETLAAAHLEKPAGLKEAVRLMAPMLRSLRLGDGGLALFNGGVIEDVGVIDQILSKSNLRARTISSAPHSGFHRLSGGRSTVIMDAGNMPGGDANRWGHAGALSFEMSAGRERLIVNCGGGGLGGEWRQALRSTAAHSTVVMGDINSAPVNPAGAAARGPRQVTSSRREHEGNTIIEAVSEGYEASLGVTHRRHLMLAPDGAALDGEDQLFGKGCVTFDARFHLHPNVQATVIQDGHGVLIKPHRGKGWKFNAGKFALTLEDSVYFDAPQRRRRTQQIVISGHTKGAGAMVKWRMTRL